MKVKRCKICNRLIRSYNRSGYCQNCYIRVYKAGDKGYYNNDGSKVYKLEFLRKREGK